MTSEIMNRRKEDAEGFSNPKHPVWRLANVIVVMSCLTVVLWTNAQDFDATEIRSLVEMGAIIIGLETVRQKSGA